MAGGEPRAPASYEDSSEAKKKQDPEVGDAAEQN
jgi:hypothetical protein